MSICGWSNGLGKMFELISALHFSWSNACLMFRHKYLSDVKCPEFGGPSSPFALNYPCCLTYKSNVPVFVR